ncbi:MAG: LacI family DNA-binding transcriptional regulator [Armatimonadota bacterium]
MPELDDIPSQPGSPVTIYDIARQLGLSPSTVGHALNGTGRVSQKTCERVVEAAAKMGYRPSLVAKSLSNSRTRTLGVLVPIIGNTAYSNMVHGIEAAAYQAGYNIILCCSEFDQNREHQYLEMLCNRRVEGIIVIPSRRVNSHKQQVDHLVKIQQSGIPLVVLEQNLPDQRLSRVVMDNYGAAKQLVQHLITLHHERIGFLHLGYEQTDYAGNERFNGYLAALSEAGLHYTSTLSAQAATVSVYEDEGDSKAQFEAYYQAANQPSAVFAVNDILAIKLIQACQMIGLRVPEDVAVVGFDNITVSALISPPLTTIYQPAEEMGKRATELIFDAIHGQLQTSVHEVLPGKLIVRQSCGQSTSKRNSIS